MEIASHLDRYDLCRLVNVNSHFRAVVRKFATPWAYEHGTLAALGSLRFPLAVCPYLFWRTLSRFDEEDTLPPDTDRAKAVARVKRIDVKPHTTADCSNFENGPLGSVTWKSPKCDLLRLNVLHIQLYFPRQPNKHDNPQYLYHIDVSEDEHVCPFFKSLLGPHNVQRIVMKDIPRITRIRNPHYEFEHDFRGEFVSVLFSHSSRPAATRGYACTYTHDFGFNMPERVGLSWTREVVVVFWTERPGQVWIPPCRHGETEDEDDFWCRLARAAFDHCVPTVTIVNAGAVLPCQTTVETYETMVQEVIHDPNPFTQVEKWKEFYDEASENPEFDDIVSDWRFLKMQDWIRRTRWQDIFTPAEIEPWLECIRKEDEEKARREQGKKDEETRSAGP